MRGELGLHPESAPKKQKCRNANMPFQMNLMVLSDGVLTCKRRPKLGDCFRLTNIPAVGSMSFAALTFVDTLLNSRIVELEIVARRFQLVPTVYAGINPNRILPR